MICLLIFFMRIPCSFSPQFPASLGPNCSGGEFMMDVWKNKSHRRERAVSVLELLPAEQVCFVVYETCYLYWSQNQNILSSSFECVLL